MWATGTRHNGDVRADAKTSQAILAFAKAIEAKFNQGDWLRLALVTDSHDVIRGHRRLLRSLEWGDSDYAGNILEVLPQVLGAPRNADLKARAADCFPNLGVIEDQVGLQGWLATNDHASHEALYAGEDTTVLDGLNEASESLGIPDIDMHAVRIRRGLRDDPAQAIGSAKELLETTLKAILGLHGTGTETKLEIPKLIKRANVRLGLDAATTPDNEPGAINAARSSRRSRRLSPALQSYATPGSARDMV